MLMAWVMTLSCIRPDILPCLLTCGVETLLGARGVAPPPLTD